jgi:hypothetical protein
MKELTYDEFLEKFVKPNKQWKFDLFKIVCVKCGGTKVEFNSNLEVESGWYGDFIKEGKIIIKCHDCGNAFTLDFYDLEEVY